MNERIQELIEQSKCLSDGYNTGAVDLEKFAELIVQDCISQTAMIGVSNSDDPDVVWTVDKAIQNIKQHFGIEP
jgi:hypothetical protein